MLSLSRSLPLRRLALPVTAHPFITSATRRSNADPASGAAEQLDGERLIEAKLIDKFAPCQVKVQDVSGGCGTFYAITVASEMFKGLTIVKQHKLVTETLKQEIGGIHGLQIKTTVK